MFWPSMMTLRARFIPEDSRSTIINIFRIPLNAFVCLILYNVSAAGWTSNREWASGAARRKPLRGQGGLLEADYRYWGKAGLSLAKPQCATASCACLSNTVYLVTRWSRPSTSPAVPQTPFAPPSSAGSPVPAILHVCTVRHLPGGGCHAAGGGCFGTGWAKFRRCAPGVHCGCHCRRQLEVFAPIYALRRPAYGARCHCEAHA